MSQKLLSEPSLCWKFKFNISWLFVFGCLFLIVYFYLFIYFFLLSSMSETVCFQNPLLEGGELSTMIAAGPGMDCRDEFGKPMYRNRRSVS